MRVAFVADVHVGNPQRFGGDIKAGINKRCQMVLDSLAKAVVIAAANKSEYFVICGDLIDYVKIEPQIIAAIQLILRDAKRLGMQAVLLKGNHENVSQALGDHALGPLKPLARIVEVPTTITHQDGSELMLIPHQSGAASQWLSGAVEGLVNAAPPGRPNRTLAIHLGVSDTDTPPWLVGARDSVDVNTLATLCEKNNISYVFAGNWHDRKIWSRQATRICQIGALSPTGWDNPGLNLYGGVALFDSTYNGVPTVETVPGPRFVKSGSSDLAAALQDAKVAKDSGCFIFLQVVTNKDNVSSLKEELKLVTWLEAFEVVADAKEAEKSARAAASAASSAQTIDQSIVNFIDNMQLDQAVDKKELLERVKSYMQKS